MITTPSLHTTMAELLGGWPSARAVLARRGMACVGCSMASFETISEAAVAYGFDPREFIGEVVAARLPRDRSSRSRRREAPTRTRHHSATGRKPR